MAPLTLTMSHATMAGDAAPTVTDTSGDLLDTPPAADIADLALAAPVSRLPEGPHFTPGGDLYPASADFGAAPAMKAIAGAGVGAAADGNTIALGADARLLSAADITTIADLGSALVTSGHGISMGADALDLTAAAYTALLADHLVRHGIMPGVGHGDFSASEAAAVRMASTMEPHASFTVTACDIGGETIAVSEAADGSTPVVVLDAGSVASLVCDLGGSFAASGAIEVGTGKFVDLYQAGSVPAGTSNASLIYNPAAHTISLDVPGQDPVTLITLGGTADPQGLDASGILFKHHD